MKLIIDIDEEIAQGIIDGKGEIPRNIVRSFQATIADAIKNSTPLEFCNISVEAIAESSHCPACIHYIQRDIPNVFCEKCVNRDEVYRRIENGI